MAGLVIFWSAVVIGALLAIQAGFAWAQADEAAMANIRRTALRLKQEADASAYERYMADFDRQNR
jgi:hypothetical protein